MNIFEVLQKVEEAERNFDQIVKNSIENAKPFIKQDLIQAQLYAGVDGNLKELTPSYLDDPFFVQITKDPKRSESKNKEAAIRYSEWWRDNKLKITPPIPNPELKLDARDADTPNLIIIGTFYDSIYVNVDEKSIKIGTSGVDFGADIEKKYGSEIFKLSPNAIKYLIFEHLYPDLEKYFKKMGFK